MFVDLDRAVFNLGLLADQSTSQNPVSLGTCGAQRSISNAEIGLIVLSIVVLTLLVPAVWQFFTDRRKLNSISHELTSIRLQIAATGAAVTGPGGTPSEPDTPPLTQ